MMRRSSLWLLLALATACGDNDKPNIPPELADVSVSTAEDTPVTITVSPKDANGDTLDIDFGTPSHGTITGTGASVTYTPRSNYAGEDSFKVEVSDGKATTTATVTVTVSAVNDAPVANDVTVRTIMDTATLTTLAATDAEGDTLTFSVVTAPASGTLSGTGANLTYTPNAGYHGTDSFTFQANDGSLDSNVATVSITVAPPPVCGDGNVDPGEVCDDGNRVAGDGCRADCRGQEVCGDGIVDSTVGEQCDDGGTEPGDGCDASCKLDAFSNVPSQIISGSLSCNTDTASTGRKVAVDALGRLFVAMKCGGTGYVSVSVNRGMNWSDPISTGITGVLEIAIEGGPTGTAYVAAVNNEAKLMFTRTTDAGSTWETPLELTTLGDSEISMDSFGDALYIAGSLNGGTLRILRNFSRGTGAFSTLDLAQFNAYHDIIVDKISGDVYAASDNPAFRIRRSSDQGMSFGAESQPPGHAFFSDWTGSNGFIYVTGTAGDDNIDVIPVADPGTSTQVRGLPSDVDGGILRCIDADALGNAYVATNRDTGDIQLDRMLYGATSVSSADARIIGPGTAPAVAALPSNSGAIVAYTNGTSVYGAVVVY